MRRARPYHPHAGLPSDSVIARVVALVSGARPAALSLATLAWLVVARPAGAAWPRDPTVNLPVCTATGDQSGPRLVSDGGMSAAGAPGAIIVWIDARGGGNDIYAQHVLAGGIVDPAWSANGVALCTAAGNQSGLMPVSDGAGGAIVAWIDARSGSYDIYAQHVLAGGMVDPAWPANGRAICTAAGNQFAPSLAGDGAGGAIIVWYDSRGTNSDIYSQRVLAGGAVDPAWPADGRALCTAAGNQYYPAVVSDAAGGAVVAWEDHRFGDVDIYAQHVLPGGTVDPAWPADGRALCSGVNPESVSGSSGPALVPDGTGGAIAAWRDERYGVNGGAVCAQRVLPVGAADPAWPANGCVLRAVGPGDVALNTQRPALVTDGAGGAIAAWYETWTIFDFVLGRIDRDRIFAAHVGQRGRLDPAWGGAGVLSVCDTARTRLACALANDGAGGALIAWQDSRGGTTNDVYATHVLAGGVMEAGWSSTGRALTTAANHQQAPQMLADGAGGAMVAWQDSRSGALDIYAQRVARFGALGAPEPTLTAAHDVPGDQGGAVTLTWSASDMDAASDPDLAAYDLYRSVPAGLAAFARADGALRVLADGPAALPAAATGYAWQYTQTVSPDHSGSAYSAAVPTAFDSVGGSNPRTTFLVLARNATGTMFWPSRPDSGYSVDNLAPATPSPFLGAYGAGSTNMVWGANAEPDLASYRLHRGTTPEFVPGPENLVAQLTDTRYIDNTGAPYYYRLAAIDVHGNASGFAFLLPSGALDVAGDAAVAFALEPLRPNPARAGALVVRFALPDATPASLELLDVAGRRLAARAVGALGAGHHAISLAGGRRLAPGLYLVRLARGTDTRVTRVIVLD